MTKEYKLTTTTEDAERKLASIVAIVDGVEIEPVEEVTGINEFGVDMFYVKKTLIKLFMSLIVTRQKGFYLRYEVFGIVS